LEGKIAARLAKNKQLIDSLKALNPVPLYANSVLQAARYNKYKVLEAQLSIMDTNKRVEQVDIGEESVGRTPLMFAAYYNDMESLEILVASNARVQLKDKKGRTAMHYAA
jgi:ankyrin repeat protein